jgi:hypothetical protein
MDNNNSELRNGDFHLLSLMLELTVFFNYPVVAPGYIEIGNQQGSDESDRNAYKVFAQGSHILVEIVGE